MSFCSTSYIGVQPITQKYNLLKHKITLDKNKNITIKSFIYKKCFIKTISSQESIIIPAVLICWAIKN